MGGEEDWTFYGPTEEPFYYFTLLSLHSLPNYVDC